MQLKMPKRLPIAVTVAVLAIAFVIGAQPLTTSSVTGDVTTGWQYQDRPDGGAAVAMRCLPGTDVLVVLINQAVTAAPSNLCTVPRGTKLARSRVVDGDIGYPMKAPVQVTYGCVPAAHGMGSGVLLVSTPVSQTVATSVVCGPM